MKRQTFRWLAQGLALCSIAVAVPALAKDKPVAPDKARLAAASTRMTRLFYNQMNAVPAEQAQTSLRLDLADHAQYQFVFDRLLAAGNTPDNSPRLFKALETARKLAREGLVAEAARDCSQLITLEDSPLAGTTEYRSSALVSCFGNDGYLFSDLTAFQANADNTNVSLLEFRASEQYGTHVGSTEDASLRLTYGYKKEQLLQLDSLVLAFDAKTGAALASYATVATSGTPEVSTRGLADPVTTIYHPKNLIDKLGETVLRICLQRGTYTGANIDCDYGSVVQSASGLGLYPVNNDWNTLPNGLAGVAATASQTSGYWTADNSAYFVPTTSYDTSRTYVPLRGQHDAGETADGACSITSYSSAFTYAKLYMVQPDSTYCNVAAGALLGTVNLTSANAGLLTGAKFTPFQMTLDYGQICVGYEKTTKLVVAIGAKATCGAATNLARYKTTTIDSIQFRNSCFASGTEVARADGSKTAIESIKVGDKVLANDKGLVLTVTTLSRGVENSAMVRLKDNKGQEVLVTQTHPVMTATRGAVPAESLKVGDLLITQEGPAALVSVSRELYKGPVYNLAVGTAEELAKLTPEQRTLFAGGMLMGDYTMQAEMDAARLKPSAAQASIPAAWVVDYANDMARK